MPEVGEIQLGFGGAMAPRSAFEAKGSPALLCYSATVAAVSKSTATVSAVAKSTATIEGC